MPGLSSDRRLTAKIDFIKWLGDKKNYISGVGQIYRQECKSSNTTTLIITINTVKARKSKSQETEIRRTEKQP